MVIPQSFVHKKSDVAGTGPTESFPRCLYCCCQDISLLEFTAQCGRRGKRQVGQICMLSSTCFWKGLCAQEVRCFRSERRRVSFIFIFYFLHSFHWYGWYRDTEKGGIFYIYLLLSSFFPWIWLIRRYINVSFVLKKCGVSRAREEGYLLYLSSTFFILSIDMVDTEIY